MSDHGRTLHFLWPRRQSPADGGYDAPELIAFMRFARHPRLSRILVLLALFQMVAPSVAALADAWRLDRRQPYAHVESESGPSCVVVHANDCVLCSIATAPTGTLPPSSCAALLREAINFSSATSWSVARQRPSLATSPRAPPAQQG